MFLCMGLVGDVSLGGHRGIPRGKIWNYRLVWPALLWEMWLRVTALGVLMGLCIFVVVVAIGDDFGGGYVVLFVVL